MPKVVAGEGRVELLVAEMADGRSADVALDARWLAAHPVYSDAASEVSAVKTRRDMGAAAVAAAMLAVCCRFLQGDS